MRIETDFVDHPKTYRLAARFGGDHDAALAVVLRAWSWLSRFCPTGHVRDIDGTAFGTACKWRGGPVEALNSLVSAGFLEALPDGGWDAHDWSDHQGKVAAKASKERDRKAAYRAKKAGNVPALSHGTDEGTDAGRPAQRDVTGRDVTGRINTMSSTLDLVPTEPPKQPDDVPEKLRDKLTDDEFQVFEHWRQTLNHPKAIASPERKRLIAKWLPIYGVERLQAAITGCSASAHHMGQNDRHTRYDSLELILRDAKHIEDFETMASGRAA